MWFFVFGALFGVLSFVHIIFGISLTATVIIAGSFYICLAAIALFGLWAILRIDIKWISYYIMLSCLSTLLLIAMSVVNTCLLVVRKSQYLAQCSSDSRVTGYVGSNGQSEQDIAEDCENYFIKIAAVSIFVSLLLNIVNLAFMVKLIQYMLKARRIQDEERSHVNLQERRQSRLTEPSANSNRAPESGNLVLPSHSRSRISPAMKDTNGGLPGNNETVASSDAPETPAQPIVISTDPPQQPSSLDISGGDQQ
ncbi:hypothetical protein K450DRAFT_225552 [Umbelopsis ramanniana AG]|uniref:Uncharacterized protein n=1 Tax=Umbelopsis ramanniana AG TaxID=1314678 RepID=A0AAD5EFK6_UMBRA|nr:uncharacterized protein K450DRAFT_225552 [Umbelopsis ramanniana AG]KAI8582936.1 hypothetical protein K450DRAFT_225552 [Umbelopsis ramanniana AG]